MLVCLEGTRVHVDGVGYGEIFGLYEQADGSPKYEIIFGDGHRGFADNSKILQVSLKVKGLLPNVRRYFDYDILKNHLGFVSSSTEIDPDIYNSWVEEVKEFKRKAAIASYRLKGYSGRYPFSGNRATYYVPASSLAPSSPLPKPKHMLLNGDYTTVVWQDGTHTTVKKHPLDEDDLGKAIMFCILKKMCGSKANLDRYLDKFTDNMVVKSLGENPGMNEFLKECDAIDATGGLNQEYNPDEDDDFFVDDGHQITIEEFLDEKEDDGDDKK
jgi:hypothetical protein